MFARVTEKDHSKPKIKSEIITYPFRKYTHTQSETTQDDDDVSVTVTDSQFILNDWQP